MLCCLDYPSSYTPVDTDSKGYGGVSAYPGRRREGHYQEYKPPNSEQLVSTAGNALSTYDPSLANQGAGSGGPQLVSVTVPAGITSGQTIHVAAPDGSGQLIAAVVPQGMQAGSSFMVEYNPTTTAAATTISENDQSMYSATPIDSKPNQTKMPYEDLPLAIPLPEKAGGNRPPAIPAPVTNFASLHDQNTVPLSQPPSQTYATLPTNTHNYQQQTSTPPPRPSPNNNEQLMLVKVPAGTAPGSTIHVQVPGENRLIAAVVPPNVTEFHVSYNPSQNSTTSSTLPPSHQQYQPPPMQQPPPMMTTTNNSPSPPTGQNNKESLLLVTVPPGTTPGSTIHVQIPGENRKVAAVVPPNVTQFHVSYTPQQQQQSPSPPSNTIPPNNNYTGGVPVGASMATHGQMAPTWNQNQNNNNNSHSTTNNGDMAVAVPMIAGAGLMAAAGAIGMSMMDGGGDGGDM